MTKIESLYLPITANVKDRYDVKWPLIAENSYQPCKILTEHILGGHAVLYGHLCYEKFLKYKTLCSVLKSHQNSTLKQEINSGITWFCTV